MPKLENVLLVNGLKVNLINTSKLYDHILFFKFTKEKCSVTAVQTHVLWKEKDH